MPREKRYRLVVRSAGVEFDLGLAPEVKLNISEKKDKLPYRQVDITDVVDDEIDSLRRRYGNVEQVEEVGPTDFVRGRARKRAGGWLHAFGGFPTR